MALSLEKYLRVQKLPHIWCPGCGHGIITQAVIRAIDESGIDADKTVIVSGIGCSSRAPGYMNFDTLHTTHGRAPPSPRESRYQPDLTSSDNRRRRCSGDSGNHLIHAAGGTSACSVLQQQHLRHDVRQYPLTLTGSYARPRRTA